VRKASNLSKQSKRPKPINQTPYPMVNEEDIRYLISIAGRENVITGYDNLLDYAQDETPMVEASFPQVVVKPLDTRTVSAILKYANSRGLPITPRGAGTGLSGGCIPLQGGIVLSVSKLDSIVDIDRENFVAVVQSGLSLGILREKVEAVGLSYPVSLGEMTATIGGSIATNAGGLNAVKYGVTRHHVLGIEAVLADGTIIRTGGRFVKCSSGYDLTQLLTGSEGTLAIITEVTLKLNIKPAFREALFIPFYNLQDAISCIPDIMMLGKEPAGLEFMEKSIMEISELYTGKKLPYKGYEAFLLVISEGDNEGEINSYFNQVEVVSRKHGAADALVPPGELAMRRLLEAREMFYHAIKKFAPMQILDVVVPRIEIARFIAGVKELEPKYNIPVIVYGHAGDGNVHLHPICKDMPLVIWKKKLHNLMKDIYILGARHGGAVSGEHGIGIDKKEFFNNTADKSVIDVMRGIKHSFDPKGILNPGKIFS
jgi:glycolate oxidase